MSPLGKVGEAVLALTIILFILLIIVIIVALVCCCLWRCSWRFRSHYDWTGPNNLIFVDRTNFSGEGDNSLFANSSGNLRGLRPPERSVHTQTNLTAIVVLQKPSHKTMGIGSVAANPVVQSRRDEPLTSVQIRRDEPLANAENRWSRINPKLSLNPWSYQKQTNVGQTTRSAQGSPRRVYVEEF